MKSFEMWESVDQGPVKFCCQSGLRLQFSQRPKIQSSVMFEISECFLVFRGKATLLSVSFMTHFWTCCADILIGMPLASTGNLETKLATEHSRFLVAELNVRVS